MAEKIIISGSQINFTSNGLTNSKIISSSDTIIIEGTGSSTALLTGVSEPISDTDATNKGYNDKKTWKYAVRIATTISLGLSGLSAIDTITPIAGNRILVKNQGTQTENGIYLAASGPWSRSDDALEGYTATGTSVMVTEGSQSGSFWICNTASSTFNFANITFIELSAGTSTPGGNSTEIQYNNNSNFDGSSDFTYTGSSIDICTGISNSITNIGTRPFRSSNISLMTNSSTGTINIGSATSVIRFKGTDVSIGAIWERTTPLQLDTGQTTMIFSSNVWTGDTNSPGESNGVVTINSTGLYEICFTVISDIASTVLSGHVLVSGVQYLYDANLPKSGTGHYPSVKGCGVLFLTSGTELIFRFQSSSANNQSICSSSEPGNFSVIRISGSVS